MLVAYCKRTYVRIAFCILLEPAGFVGDRQIWEVRYCSHHFKCSYAFVIQFAPFTRVSSAAPVAKRRLNTYVRRSYVIVFWVRTYVRNKCQGTYSSAAQRRVVMRSAWPINPLQLYACIYIYVRTETASIMYMYMYVLYI